MKNKILIISRIITIVLGLIIFLKPSIDISQTTRNVVLTILGGVLIISFFIKIKK